MLRRERGQREHDFAAERGAVHSIARRAGSCAAGRKVHSGSLHGRGVLVEQASGPSCESDRCERISGGAGLDRHPCAHHRWGWRSRARTPEASLSELVDAGLTTVVGTLGTDCVSRSLENLRAKAAALKEEGLTAYMWSGCYRVPSPTLTGSLVRDLQLVEEVVGAGEIAISDHRGSWPSTGELLKIVSDARVGGMLSGKAGVAHFHTGAASSMLDPLWEVINVSKGAIPITQMIPTHISSRGEALLEAAEAWVQAGGYVDLTSDQEGESASFAALRDWHQKGTVALDHVSLSSDGFGSLPFYSPQGDLLKYGIASPKANLYTIQQLVLTGGWTFQQALLLSTLNPATFLSFKTKGRVEVGMDGDIIVLDALTLEVEYVIAMGQLMKTPTWTKTGLFGK